MKISYWSEVKNSFGYIGFYIWMAWVTLPAIGTFFTEMWPLGVLLIVLGFVMFPANLYVTKKLNKHTK